MSIPAASCHSQPSRQLPGHLLIYSLPAHKAFSSGHKSVPLSRLYLSGGTCRFRCYIWHLEDTMFQGVNYKKYIIISPFRKYYLKTGVWMHTQTHGCTIQMFSNRLLFTYFLFNLKCTTVELTRIQLRGDTKFPKQDRLANIKAFVRPYELLP
jgi:hypothetical protein